MGTRSVTDAHFETIRHHEKSEWGNSKATGAIEVHSGMIKPGMGIPGRIFWSRAHSNKPPMPSGADGRTIDYGQTEAGDE
jgi:hypothetical protein